MYWKHKIYIHCFWLILFASSLHSSSIIDGIKKFFSVNLSEDIFEAVNKNIVGSLHAKNMRFYFPNRVSMDDLEVLDENGDRVLYGKHVDLSISLLSLLTNNIVVSDAFVEAPFFHYKIKNRIHNVIRIFESRPGPELKPPADDDSKIRVSIAHVRVQNGSYEMEHDVGLKITAEGIKAEGKFWVEKGPFGVDIGRANIDRGAINIAGMDLPITNLVAQNLFISDEKVSTSHLTALYEKAVLTADGTVFIDEDHYKINATLDAPKNTYPKGLKKIPLIPPSFVAKIIMAGSLVEPEFYLNAHIGETEFNGLKINNGTIVAHINEHQIAFESSTLHVGDQGRITADGVIDIEKDLFSFRSSQAHLSSKDLLKFLSVDLSSNGRINAKTSFEGKLALNDAPMHIKSEGNIVHGSIDKAYLAPKTNFNVSFILEMPKRVTFKEIKLTDDQGIRIKGAGGMALTLDDGGFSFDINCPAPNLYFSSWIPKDIKSQNISSVGKINWQQKNINAQGNLTIGKLSYKNVSAGDIYSQYRLDQDELSLSNIAAKLYQGELTGSAVIQHISKERKINSAFTMNGVDIAPLFANFTDAEITGKIDGKVSLLGQLEKVQAHFSLKSEQAAYQHINLAHISLEGIFAEHRVEVSQLISSLSSGIIEGRDLSYNIDNKDISGFLFLSDISIAQLLFKYAKVEGLLSGPIDIGGNWTSPHISAALNAKNIAFEDQKLGSGPLSLSLKREKLIDSGAEEDVVFSLSSTLRQEKAVSTIRYALALNRQTINSTASFRDFELSTSDFGLNNAPIGIKGVLFADIAAYGPLTSPKLDGQIVISDYGFFDPKKLNAQLFINKKYGPATINASLNNGQFQLELCAPWVIGSSVEGCNFQRGLSAIISGSMNLKEFSLDLDSSIRHDHLEDIIPLLNDELAMVDAEARIQGKLTKKINKPVEYNLKLFLEHIMLSLPNIPNIKLEKPVLVALKNKEISLHDEAAFSFSPGKMIIKGASENGNLDIHVGGSIPLVLSKLFVPIIQRGEGLATGDLHISGSMNSPLLDGSCEPEKGAMLSFKKWVDSLEFRSGKISFKKTSPHSFISKFDHFKLGVGDGWLLVNGKMNKKYQSSHQNETTNFDISVEGSNIIIRDKNDFIETDFKLDTIKSENKSSILSGKITVVDGSAYRQFDLRNFVIQAAETSGTSMGKMLDTIDLQLNLEIAVRQFKASMRMLNIDVDTILTGQLKVNGPISRSKFTGGLSVSEGAVNFPAATFDLVESRIELDELTDRPFDPKITISSTQEFGMDYYPELSQDTTVELSLKGNLERLNLELKPVNGDVRLSQSRIFLMLILPRGIKNNQSDTIPQNAKNAVVAFSGEVFLRPLTNELQDLLEGTTRTKIQFGSALEPGGVTLRLNWKLGPRIEVQGNYMFITEDARTPGEDKLSMFGNYPFRDLKLKLLLFDHRPLGPLFLESSFGANRYVDGTLEPRGKIRLSYRILSQ